MNPKTVTKRIKKPHIIHMLENVNDRWGSRYMCNWCVEPTPEKSTWDKSKVTCKNCLQKIKSRDKHSNRATLESKEVGTIND